MIAGGRFRSVVCLRSGRGIIPWPQGSGISPDQDAEIGLPWSDGTIAAGGQASEDLLEMIEVVNRPSSKQLTQGNLAKLRVATATVEFAKP